MILLCARWPSQDPRLHWPSECAVVFSPFRALQVLLVSAKVVHRPMPHTRLHIVQKDSPPIMRTLHILMLRCGALQVPWVSAKGAAQADASRASAHC